MHVLNAATAWNRNERVSLIFSCWRSGENKAIRQIGKWSCNLGCLAGLISLASIIAAALFLFVASVNKNSLARQCMSVLCSCRHQLQLLLLFLCKHKIYNLWRMSFVSSPAVLLATENVKIFIHSLLGNNEAFGVWLCFIDCQILVLSVKSSDYNHNLNIIFKHCE